MDELAILRTVAACTTILAAAMAANITPRITVAVFAIFIVLPRLDGGQVV
jgi:hypothetical protein